MAEQSLSTGLSGGMTTWRRMGLKALALAAVGWVVWLVLNSSETEPVYQGKTLTIWLEEASDFSGTGNQRAAVAAIRKIGTNALPPLVRMLLREDSHSRLRLLGLAGKVGLGGPHFERASDVRIRAAYGCSLLGPVAKPTIPALLKALQHEEGSIVIAGALIRIGPDGVEGLVGSLTNASTNVRHDIAAALADIGVRRSVTNSTPEQKAIAELEASIALPALMGILRNKTDQARGQAALSLGVIGIRADIVVPELITALQSADDPENGVSVAMAAASGLGRYGSEAQGAVPALMAAIKNRAPGLHKAAAEALERIDPDAAIKAGVK